MSTANPSSAPDPTCPLSRVLAGAGSRLQELAEDLGRFSATAIQTHEQIDRHGRPHGRETRKSRYVASIADSPGGPSLEEDRVYSSGQGWFSDGVQATGLLALAMIFHPAIQQNYQMTCEGLGLWKGEHTWIVGFRQRSDRPRRQLAFHVGRSYYQLALQGHAWISAESMRVVHIEAELLEPVPKLELMIRQSADYRPVEFKTKNTSLWLPADSQVEFEYRKRRYRCSDHFQNFVLFSVDTQQQVQTSALQKER